MGDIKELVESDSVLRIKMKGKNKKNNNNSNIFGFFSWNNIDIPSSLCNGIYKITNYKSGI